MSAEEIWPKHRMMKKKHQLLNFRRVRNVRPDREVKPDSDADLCSPWQSSCEGQKTQFSVYVCVYNSRTLSQTKESDQTQTLKNKRFEKSLLKDFQKTSKLKDSALKVRMTKCARTCYFTHQEIILWFDDHMILSF